MSNILSSIKYDASRGKYEKLYFAEWKKMKELFLEYEKNHTREQSERYSNPAVSITAFKGETALCQKIKVSS